MILSDYNKRLNSEVKKTQTEQKLTLKERQQKWRMANPYSKDERKEYNKKYKEENKDKLNKKIICKCGVSITERMLKRHLQTKKHKHYEQESRSNIICFQALE